jgi:PAS domain S-box-containing protein
MDSSETGELRRALAAETRAREHLQRELAVRNCALDAASSHFMILDMAQPGWPIAFANRAIARDHGYEPQELLGRSASVLIHESSARERVSIDEAIREGRSLRVELRGMHKDGSTFWVGIFLAPVRNGTDAITHYVAVGADITKRLADAENQRRLQEQLVAEMRERERMVGAHQHRPCFML